MNAVLATGTPTAAEAANINVLGLVLLVGGILLTLLWLRQLTA
jgi:hypothetical protein